MVLNKTSPKEFFPNKILLSIKWHSLLLDLYEIFSTKRLKKFFKKENAFFKRWILKHTGGWSNMFGICFKTLWQNRKKAKEANESKILINIESLNTSITMFPSWSLSSFPKTLVSVIPNACISSTGPSFFLSASPLLFGYLNIKHLDILLPPQNHSISATH